MDKEDKLTPQQIEFLKHYTDPKSDTFSDGYNSAKKAGYSEEYSKVLASRDLEWMSSFVKDKLLIDKAEENLNYFLDNCKDEKVKADITKFVLSRLNKKKYSERTEMTGADGKDLGQIFYPIRKQDERMETNSETRTSTL